MRSVDFEGCNGELRSDADLENDPPIFGLKVNDMLVSCWKLSPEELMEAAKTGRVWIAQRHSEQIFPAVPSVEPPFTLDDEEPPKHEMMAEVLAAKTALAASILRQLMAFERATGTSIDGIRIERSWTVADEHPHACGVHVGVRL